MSELESVLQARVVNGYGLTESGTVTNTHPDSPAKHGSVGKTIGPAIAIVDASGDGVAPNAEGEIMLRGNAVMAGYLDDPEANDEAFRAGWLRTGDLGRLDEEGDLFITGRLKEIINRGGETIAPLEIDHALAEHPAIAQAACFAIAHPTLGEDVAAAVVLQPNVSVSAAEIRAFLANRLSRFKIPSRFWFVESIPLSVSGKPLRSALSGAFSTNLTNSTTEDLTIRPDLSHSVRHRIAEIWMGVLHTSNSDPGQNFFGLGGDSLAAARMLAMLLKEFPCVGHLSAQARFFESPTLLQLEQSVAECLAGQYREVKLENVSAVEVRPRGRLHRSSSFLGRASSPATNVTWWTILARLSRFICCFTTLLIQPNLAPRQINSSS